VQSRSYLTRSRGPPDRSVSTMSMRSTSFFFTTACRICSCRLDSISSTPSEALFVMPEYCWVRQQVWRHRTTNCNHILLQLKEDAVDDFSFVQRYGCSGLLLLLGNNGSTLPPCSTGYWSMALAGAQRASLILTSLEIPNGSHKWSKKVKTIARNNTFMIYHQAFSVRKGSYSSRYQIHWIKERWNVKIS